MRFFQRWGFSRYWRQVPIQQVLIGTGEEGAAAAGGIEDAQLGRCVRCHPFQQRADGVLDDVVDDIARRVIDAAGFAHFGFFFDRDDWSSIAIAAHFDDLAEEALVDLAEDVGADDRELVAAFGRIEIVDDAAQDAVDDVDFQGQSIGLRAGFVGRVEVEEAGVVAPVGGAVKLLDLAVDIAADGGGAFQAAVAFEVAVFGDAQEDDAVDGALHQVVEFALVEPAVDEGRLPVQLPRQVDAPGFHIAQEGFVNAQHAFGGRLQQVAVLALPHRLGRERFLQPSPFSEVLRMGEIHDAGFGGESPCLGSMRQS